MPGTWILGSFVEKGRMRGWICLLAVCLLAACADSDDKERWVMKDGTVLYVEPEVRQYASEQEFADGMAAVHTRQSGGGEGPVEVDVEADSVYGAKDIRVNGWEKARFGPWAEAFGLKAGKTYFVCTVTVMKEIPHDGADYMAMGIYRGRDLDSIGFAPFGEGVVRGYYVRSSEADAPWEARTMLRCVGYDGEGNTVGCYYPVGKVENLKWRYFRVYE